MRYREHLVGIGWFCGTARVRVIHREQVIETMLHEIQEYIFIHSELIGVRCDVRHRNNFPCPGKEPAYLPRGVGPSQLH
jgi:hypothetical protein